MSGEAEVKMGEKQAKSEESKESCGGGVGEGPSPAPGAAPPSPRPVLPDAGRKEGDPGVFTS